MKARRIDPEFSSVQCFPVLPCMHMAVAITVTVLLSDTAAAARAVTSVLKTCRSAERRVKGDGRARQGIVLNACE